MTHYSKLLLGHSFRSYGVPDLGLPGGRKLGNCNSVSPSVKTGHRNIARDLQPRPRWRGPPSGHSYLIGRQTRTSLSFQQFTLNRWLHGGAKVLRYLQDRNRNYPSIFGNHIALFYVSTISSGTLAEASSIYDWLGIYQPCSREILSLGPLCYPGAKDLRLLQLHGSLPLYPVYSKAWFMILDRQYPYFIPLASKINLHFVTPQKQSSKNELFMALSGVLSQLVNRIGRW